MKWAAAGIWALAASAYSSSKAAPAKEYLITGTDYAFQAPSTVPAGRIQMRFVNKGKKRHEFNVTQLKPGVSIDSLVHTLAKGGTVRQLITGPVGVLFAGPGETSAGALATDAEAGTTLAVICIFRDSANAPRHYDMGMYTTIKVVKSPNAAKQPPIPVDTIVGQDYSYLKVRNVPEGLRAFAFKNAGKQRHEMTIELLAPGKTLKDLIEADKKGADVEPLFDKTQGLTHVYGGEVARGQVVVDVLPGRDYVVECGFQDDDKAPPHYKLGMVATFRGIPLKKKSK